ncbi:MAG: alpha-ketoacid dehydrogenase subunit beta [Anaerolineae bacterium]|nr:alpha-ketoacid dehydrogenase subunit beta [Anaerolineae bacterium]
MTELTYLQAISAALWEEMEADERVLLLGEDIGPFGGAFKVTKGFVERFGERRVMDMPMSEWAFVGAAIGAAMLGLRPVVEIQFADFIATPFDMIVNQAATCYYRWQAPVPLVIRAPSGGGLRAGPFHSQNPEAWFVHRPGLKVVAPASPRDAKGLLRAAIRDNNPVIYFENKYLYRKVKEDVPDGDWTVPIGQADVKRRGRDVSVIAYGSMVYEALEAAETVAAGGIDVEVLDLRTLLPLDRDAILGTAERTGKVIVVHEATLTGGVGGEVTAIIAEHAFELLDAPLVRLAAPDTPVPFSPPLEDFFRPNAVKIAEAVRKLAAY